MGKSKENLKEKNGLGVGRVLLIVVFLLVAAALVLFILFSKECGGSVDVQQAGLELPETTTTTITTTTSATTTTTTTAVTTTTTEAIDYEMKMDISYVKEYKSVNPDVVGWIYIEDTPIDYPVVRAGDNIKYIHSDWKGNSSFAGCIYEDFRSELAETNLSLIYGHNMGNGSMFHGVKYYLDEDFGKEHPYFEIGTEDERYLYEVLAVSVLYGEEGAAFGYWMPNQKTDLTLSKEDFKEYAEQVKDTAQIWYKDEDYMPEYGDKLVGLQTCYSGANDGMRCILFGRLIDAR